MSSRKHEYKIGDRVAYERFRPNIHGQFVAVYQYGEIIGYVDGKFIIQAEGGELFKAKAESLGDVVPREG